MSCQKYYYHVWSRRFNLFRMISSKVDILTHLRTEHVIKSILADRVTLRLSKHMLIVKITCFIVEIFALKADVLREISTKKQEIWDFDGSQPKFLMDLKQKIQTSTVNFLQTMRPKNMKQIITNRELPVLLKDAFIKFFGDVLAVISIF